MIEIIECVLHLIAVVMGSNISRVFLFERVFLDTN